MTSGNVRFQQSTTSYNRKKHHPKASLSQPLPLLLQALVEYRELQYMIEHSVIPSILKSIFRLEGKRKLTF